MNNIAFPLKRRLQIFATGLLPLLALCAILAMASRFGLDVVSVLTHAEKRDASNYVMVTKVFGIPVRSRPATESDLAQEDAAIRTVKTAVLIGSMIIVSIGTFMCFSSATGRPRWALEWFDQKLGSVQWSWQRPNA